ncbi:coiled coil domain-containing protein [Legionella sainthelensi]|uniref:Coiled coil domain-containing protein n=1 Tax=Legionella sainthelensi TaxID=28087 RepID=A0A0W0YB01_9GAMM|nr:hypothetical protein [Legionella sainthelensi]KTD54061.1 coiled coil domain-containing protein [Legionella sainthelensi]VEH35655.1 coiled coil domain protein [Legionella sainthelensi]
MTFRQGLFDIFDSRKYLRELTPEAEKALLQKLRDKIGLSPFDFQDKAFNEHDTSRVRNYSGFKLQIGEDKENTFDKLLRGKEPEKEKVKEEFEKVFKKEDFYDTAKESYNRSIAAFKDIIVEKVPRPYSPEDIRGELTRIQTNARNAIAAQQKLELERFKTTVESQTDNLKAALNIDDDQEINKVKANLIKELEDTHKKQLDAFDKAAAENVTLLDKAANSQMEHYIFAAQMEKYAYGQSDARKRQEMLLAIDAAIAKRLKDNPQANTTIEAHVGPDGMSISALDPMDLEFFYTPTGKKIEQKKPGVWSIEFSPRIFDPGYYLGFPANQEKPKADLLALAQTIRAAGFKGIKMTVDFPNDPHTEKQRLKQAYEACLEAGFPPVEFGDDGKPKKPQYIVLVDSKGREVNIQELFKDDGPKLGMLHQQAKEQRKALDDRKNVLTPSKKSPPEVTNALKTDLSTAKNKGKTGADILTQEKEKEVEEHVERVLKGPV